MNASPAYSSWEQIMIKTDGVTVIWQWYNIIHQIAFCSDDRQPSLDCRFEDEYLCGYTNHGRKWSANYETGNRVAPVDCS